MSKNKSDDIIKLIDFCISYIKRNDLREINDLSPRNETSFWFKICVAYHGKYEFKNAVRIKNLWTNNSHNFKTKVDEMINSKEKVWKLNIKLMHTK